MLSLFLSVDFTAIHRQEKIGNLSHLLNLHHLGAVNESLYIYLASLVEVSITNSVPSNAQEFSDKKNFFYQDMLQEMCILFNLLALSIKNKTWIS